MLVEAVGDNTEFKTLFDQFKSEGVEATEPVPIPNSQDVGINVIRIPVQEATIAQLDIALKNEGFFMHEVPGPIR